MGLQHSTASSSCIHPREFRAIIVVVQVPDQLGAVLGARSAAVLWGRPVVGVDCFFGNALRGVGRARYTYNCRAYAHFCGRHAQTADGFGCNVCDTSVGRRCGGIQFLCVVTAAARMSANFGIQTSDFGPARSGAIPCEPHRQPRRQPQGGGSLLKLLRLVAAIPSRASLRRTLV